MPRRGGGSPYLVLAAAMDEIGADGSPERVLQRLVRNLADGTGADFAAIRSSVDGRAVEVTVGKAPSPRDGPGASKELPVPAGLPSAATDGAEPASVAIAKPARRPFTEQDDVLLAQTAQCVGVLLRGVLLEAELSRRVNRASELEAQLAASRDRLHAVHALERRRIATEMLSLTTPLLARIRGAVRECADALANDAESALRTVERLGAQLDELIDRFRSMVRGVHSAVLAHRGPLAALEEVAADLPRPVHLAGELPGHVSPEVSAVLYHLTASTLRAMTGGVSADPVTVTFGWSAGRVSVRVQGRADSPGRVSAALAADSSHLAALGGQVQQVLDEAELSVLMWLPDRLEPAIGSSDPGVARPAHPDRRGAPDGPVLDGLVVGDPVLGGWAPDGVAIGSREGVVSGWLPRGAVAPSALLDRVRALLAVAVGRYAGGPDGAELAEAAARLDEPVRVAVVGRTGAGASTVVNALLGESLAPTSGRPGSRLVVWFRYGDGRGVVVHPRQGPPRRATFAATDLCAGVGWAGLTPEDVDHLTVEWPAPVLTGMTLIDVPGLEGTGLGPAGTVLDADADRAPVADAVIHIVCRRRSDDGNPAHGAVVGPRTGGPYPVVVVTHPDAVAERSAGPASGVVDLDGRLAIAARDLTGADYRALAEASPDDGDLERRYGPAGFRIAVELIRAGTVDGAAALAAELTRASGQDDVLAMLDVHVAARADVLRARSALHVLGAVLHRHGRADRRLDPLVGEYERIVAGAHEFAELDTLAALRMGTVALPVGTAADAERLLGASGLRPRDRLGLDQTAGPADVRTAATGELARWRSYEVHPLGGRGAREACRAVARTCEGLLADGAR
jgi:50S ribosome-binding GTPase